MTDTTISLSEALKDHLREVVEREGLGALHEGLSYILDNPYDEQIEIDGYDETLNDPVKTPSELQTRVKRLRDEYGAQDYEEAVREQANIKHRPMGEEPIEVTKL